MSRLSWVVAVSLACAGGPSEAKPPAAPPPAAPAPAPAAAAAAPAPAASSVLADLSVTRLDGSAWKLDADLSGKVVLFVNVASQCGYTPQYEGLQALWAANKDKGLVIVGVPCNQFGGQEPGEPAEIASFCKLNYGVDFPLLDKQDVNGAGRSPLYQRLIAGSSASQDVAWNFEKFLVGRDGKLISRFGSKVKPDAPELAAAIATALAAS
jgi:glutathione peroxidase